jgi:hypothetical protein
MKTRSRPRVSRSTLADTHSVKAIRTAAIAALRDILACTEWEEQAFLRNLMKRLRSGGTR